VQSKKFTSGLSPFSASLRLCGEKKSEDRASRPHVTGRLLSTAVLCVLCALCGRSAAEDTITLTDGKTVKGQITKEDNDHVYIEKDGEARAILRTRITRIERVSVKTVPAVTEIKEPVSKLGEKDISILYNELKDIGASDPLKRNAALAIARQKKDDATPVLLAMLNPKMPTDEWTHISVFRALADLAPLPDQAVQTLAWCAVFDPYPEARREACNTIRRLQDDRAIRQLLNYGLSENPKQKFAAAIALHEIDDNRILAALVRAIPMPSVNANLGEQGTISTPTVNLPVGPGGTRMPIFLPQGSISGIANDVSSPASDLLKLISGKDIGNMPFSWANWYREKNGEISADDRDAYKHNRSARDRMNAP